MKKRVKIILIIIIIIIIFLAALAYFLLFNKSSGFSNPDYSAGAGVGEAVGQAANSNPYENVKLNPFSNET